MEHLLKLTRDEKTVGFLIITEGNIYIQYAEKGTPSGGYFGILGGFPAFDTAHPFVTQDKHGKDVFADDEVLVYRGRENIGEGHIFFNDRFLWWTVNNSSQDNDRGYPQDWSQLTLCDVDIEIIEDKANA